MNILYISEKNIGSLATISIIEIGYPGATVMQKSLGQCSESVLSQPYDICIIDGEKLEPLQSVNLDKLLVMKNVPVLILAKKDQPLHIFLNFINNVHGLIEYDSGIDFFLNAIKVVCSGGYCYSWDVYNLKDIYSDSRLYNDDYCASIGLTRREVEIFKMYLNGATNKEISLKLSRSQKTISAHKSNILRKIGCRRLPVFVPKLECLGHGN